MDLEADKKAVVKICNRLRKAAGMGATSRMKRGVPLHGGACTVAMTLQGTGITRVGPLNFTMGTRLVSLWSALDGADAETLSRFILAFDDGKYPELEIPRTEIKIRGR